MTSRLNCHN
ncbi:unnamed protein product [Staurois parvus]|uniref:Uncharacterized protein n=1 Tax=Staurois parvus TaxID=386267 RepID=A0ABN9EXR0_9NEOB|nr:unnamed protein product [Staurois parvus]